MRAALFKKAFFRFFTGIILTALLLFLPAGSLDYWNAWLFLAVLFIPMAITGIYLMIKNPGLLEKRLEVRETEKSQKQVVAMAAIMFVLAFVVAGINYRLQRFNVPAPVVYAASILFLLFYLLYEEVLRENEFLSRSVEIQEGQKVVDTGLYGIVRHPMYAVTMVLFLAMPWILGSPVSFIIMLAYIPITVKRIRNEEEVLAEGLEGYKEYMAKVRYRLIPCIW